jgi:hypothetical protein
MASTRPPTHNQRSLRATPRRDPVITAALIAAAATIAAAAASPLAAKMINPSPPPRTIVIVVPGSGPAPSHPYCPHAHGTMPWPG